ncbi:Sulfiredoxin, chloroplastic/mitochondrial [Linum perenne]
MANLILRVPATNLRGFSVKAASSSSSNGAAPGSVQKAGPMIVEIPLDQIKRPLMRTRTNDQDKVQDLMHSIHQIGLQVPVRALDFQFLSVFELMFLRLMVFTTAEMMSYGKQGSQGAIVTKLTSDLASQQYGAKFDEEPKKLSGITSGEVCSM